MNGKDFLKKRGFSILYTVALAGFTLYAVLDTFVIPRSYVAVQQEAQDGVKTAESDTAEETKSNTNEGGTTIQSSKETQDSYKDSNISIAISQYRKSETTIYVADVTVSDAQYLKTALANNTYGKNIREATSKIAEENQAILAVNGDFYGVQNEGYVLRNGVLYRSQAADGEDLVIKEDGSFEIIQEGDITAEELLEEGAYQILSFGPALLKDGEIAVTTGQEVKHAKAENPRTAIGIIDDLHYVFVVADGRTEESKGLSLYELADFMSQLGVTTAYNLDGGGSSTLYFKGQVVNQPTADGKTITERSVSDIVYIGY